jgi:hypothetical protein
VKAIANQLYLRGDHLGRISNHLRRLPFALDRILSIAASAQPMTSQNTPFVAVEDPAPGRNSSTEDDFDHTEPLLGPSGSASQQPSQPLGMNIILGTAPLALLGVWGLTLTVWYNVIFRAEWILFSFHPVCMNSSEIVDEL